MRTVLSFSVILGIAAVLTVPATGDILVLNNGMTYVGKVSTAASGRLKLTTEYGDQFFSREDVANFWVTSQGLEAESFYQAGVLLVNKQKPDTARKLFEICVKYDPSYRDKCNAALAGGPSPVAPTLPAAVGPAGAPTATVVAPQPQVQVQQIQCSHCSGTGVVMEASSISDRQRPVPCPLCGGKGYKVLQIPPGYEICSDCNGFGAKIGSDTSSSRSSTRQSSGRSSGRRSGRGSASYATTTSSFTSRKQVCPRCGGRGYVRMPWKPPEQTPGTESTALVMSSGGPSPAPGTAPSHPTTPIGHAKAVASRVSGEGPAPGTVGRSGSPGGSPAMVASAPPGATGSEGGAGAADEEIVPDEGASAESTPDEASGGSESAGESEKASDYKEPGIAGWVGRNKLYIIAGGLAVLAFAIVFNKISAKK
jgi:hypothetical protein